MAYMTLKHIALNLNSNNITYYSKRSKMETLLVYYVVIPKLSPQSAPVKQIDIRSELFT